MPDPLYGIAIAAIAVALSIIEPRLEQLFSPLDPSGLPLGDLLRDLDAKEEDSVNWVLLPLMKEVSPSSDALPPKDFKRVKAGYNYNVAQIEVARLSAREFDTARRNFHRFLTSGLLVFVPMGLIVAAIPDEWAPLVVISAVFFFVGLMIAAGYAYSIMRGARKRYEGATIGLRERLSAQALRGTKSATVKPGEAKHHE